MNKVKEDREEILEDLRNVKQKATQDLSKTDENKSEVVQNVKYYGSINLERRDSGKTDNFKLYAVEIYDYDTNKTKSKIYLDGQEVDMGELQRTYKDLNPITDVIKKAKENQEKSDDKSADKEKNNIYDLNEMEEEKNKEAKVKDKDKNTDKEEVKKKRKPSYVIEKINPDKAKMDYWQTIKQAFNLPPEVDTLAFSYPVSSEDKVDYANITIYMLDKDDYILDNYDIDDYFEFDASTGNNPMQDDTIRHEKDENKGKTQIDENNTMIRLMAKKANDKNSYISLEQKNGSIDYNDINAGKKVVGGTQNVEHQLETDRFRVRDSEVEKMVRSNAGRYNMNEMFAEAEEHEEHGDKKYIRRENADGNKATRVECENPFIPGTDKTWEELSEETGEGIAKLQERFEREARRENDPEKIIEIIEQDYEMTGHEHQHRF